MLSENSFIQLLHYWCEQHIIEFSSNKLCYINLLFYLFTYLFCTLEL